VAPVPGRTLKTVLQKWTSVFAIGSIVRLPDATGGVAYGSVNATILNAGIFNIDSETHARVGYTVGGGIEAMVYRNWTVKLEYLYVDFGNSVGYTALPPPPPLQPENVSLKTNVVRLGVDYHFTSF
jgi:outer membrane immunogenic protein